MSEEKRTIQYTLIFVRKHDENGEPMVLLGLKKRGFGEGKLNGFGGKVEKGETLEEGAIRELEEESGLKADALEFSGRLEFDMSDKLMLVEVYSCRSWRGGEPIESDEMAPVWVHETELPSIYDVKTWADDKYWLPLLLKGEKFFGRFKYNADDATIQSHTVEPYN